MAKPKKVSHFEQDEKTGWWSWKVTWYDEDGNEIGNCRGYEPTKDAAKTRIKEAMEREDPCNPTNPQ